MKNPNERNTAIIAESESAVKTAETEKAFEKSKRAVEAAFAIPLDAPGREDTIGRAILENARFDVAIAIKKYIDIQRKSAVNNNSAVYVNDSYFAAMPSDSGMSKVMEQLKFGAIRDRETFDCLPDRIETEFVVYNALCAIEQKNAPLAMVAWALSKIASAVEKAQPKASQSAADTMLHIQAAMPAIDNISKVDRKAAHKAYKRCIEDASKLAKDIYRECKKATDTLLDRSIEDGSDLVQAAALEILEQAAMHADESNWMDKDIQVERKKKHVVRYGEKPETVCEDSRPIRQVFRAIRRNVQNTRAVAFDPACKYIYIQDIESEYGMPADTVFYRMDAFSDIGGYTVNHASIPGAPAAMGNSFNELASGDMETIDDMYRRLNSLDIGKKDRELVHRRLQGLSLNDIAIARGVSRQAIQNAARRIRNKWIESGGRRPYGYKESDTTDAFVPRPVKQLTMDGELIATYKSSYEAEKATGIKAENIRRVCSALDKEQKTGIPARRAATSGFKWMYI